MHDAGIVTNMRGRHADRQEIPNVGQLGRAIAEKFFLTDGIHDKDDAVGLRFFLS
jgi:hypothetical protein